MSCGRPVGRHHREQTEAALELAAEGLLDDLGRL